MTEIDPDPLIEGIEPSGALIVWMVGVEHRQLPAR